MAVIGYDLVCTSPLPARRVNGQIEFLGSHANGRFFNNKTATLQIPCGQCTECRLKRSREWAIRCTHEATLHRDNCFITLTYKQSPISLNYSDFQAFMKRLRSHWKTDKIRFYVGGEYGETNPKTGCKDGGIYRPHFHAILFGFNFPDRVPVRLLNAEGLEHSANLDKLWRHGFCTIGKVSFESASYIARYCMQKRTGQQADTHYMYTDPDTGEIIMRTPEFNRMSLKPGIGKNWIRKFQDDVYPFDGVISRGVETKPPRYYDKHVDETSPDLLKTVKDRRESDGITRKPDHTDRRNSDRNHVVKARSKTLIRSL
ncbi:MAG: replication initiator protein [Microvirus sp.]|nr:MAG: replication initiator protein [Microvirus sp.]